MTFCFCFKRGRNQYNLSSVDVYYTKSNPMKTTTVTLAPLPLSPDIPPVSFESDYENIIGLSGDGEISIVNNYRDSTISMESGGYTKFKPIRSQQQLFIDDTHLYATVDKTRKAKNAIKVTPNTTLQQMSLPASTIASSVNAVSSSSSHPTGSTITSTSLPPPPLPPLPPHVFPNTNVNTITISNDNDVSHRRRRPHYDEVITRESLQHRAQRLQMEEAQLPENDGASINSEKGTTTGSELYAEIANGSASGTVQDYSRPSNGSRTRDDLSECYAAVTDINNNPEQSTANRTYEDVDILEL